MVVRASSILEDFNWAAIVEWFKKLSGPNISGMENGNGSIFCSQMQPNENKIFTERIFNIPYIAGMAYKKAFTNLKSKIEINKRLSLFCLIFGQ